MPLPDPFAGRFSKPQLIGTGGFGSVYRAFDTELERDVALKFLKRELAADPEFRKRFRQEATAASRLSHPNITIVFDRGEFEGEPYIVMEFVEGETLSRVIQRRRALTMVERLLLLEQLCDGLHYAHQRHVVHRDVKPVNLILREDHEASHTVFTLKILDFGIARVASAAHTATSGFMFSPNYVSPEQVRGLEVDRRSDMFAVGAVAYELLSYKKAFEIKSTNAFTLLEEVKRKIVEEPHQPLHDVSPGLDRELTAIVDRALAKMPDDRFTDLLEMRRRLSAVRERLDDAGESTLVLTIEQQEALREARAALARDAPTEAIKLLEAALASASNAAARPALEPLLAEARARQASRRTEDQARLQRMARELSGRARAAFASGDRASALASLLSFEPAGLVANTLQLLRDADAVLGAAERGIEQGDAMARESALESVEAFDPPELLSLALERLRAAARSRDEAEAHDRGAAAQALAEARRLFQAGEHTRAVNLLAAHPRPQLVADDLARLKAAAGRLTAAKKAVETGPRDARRRLLIEVERELGTLGGAALERLRSLDRDRSREEDAGAARQAEEAEARRQRAAAAAAVAAARQAFMRGENDRAVADLERFTPRALVADALGTLLRARDTLARADQAVATRPPAERAEALARVRDLDPELAGGVLARLTARDQERTAAEQREQRRQEIATAARAAIAAAEREFAAGRYDAAIAGLAGFTPGEPVAKALDVLRSAARHVADARVQVEGGDAGARAAAIETLKRRVPPALAAHAVAELSRQAGERDAAERAEQDAAIESARAQAAVEEATALFAAGHRQEALDRLTAYRPPHRIVAAGIEQLSAHLEAWRHEKARQSVAAAEALFEAGRQREAIDRLEADPLRHPLLTEAIAAFEARLAAQQAAAAAAAAASARARFAAGDPDAALALLEAFQPRALVETTLAELGRARERLRAISGAVREGPLHARREALDELARLTPAGLFEHARDDLLEVDRERTALDERQADERLGQEAAAVGARAREAFVLGRRAEAIAALTSFPHPERVAGALTELSAAGRAIDQAADAIARGAADRREAALERLSTHRPGDLVAAAIAELKAAHRARLDAERRAREEAEARAQAERAMAEARETAERGDLDGALAGLETFQPASAVAAGIDELRRWVASREAVAEGQRALTAGRLADAVTSANRARTLRSDQPGLEALDAAIAEARGAQRAQRIGQAVWLSTRVALPLLLAAGLVAGGYRYFTAERPEENTVDAPAPVPATRGGVTPLPPDGKKDIDATPAVLTSVLIDAQPWARVTLRPLASASGQAPVTLETPARFQVLPGEYEVSLENGGVTPPLTQRLRVGGEPLQRSFAMPGFSPGATVDRLLGSTR